MIFLRRQSFAHGLSKKRRIYTTLRDFLNTNTNGAKAISCLHVMKKSASVMSPYSTISHLLPFALKKTESRPAT
eukprot:UN19193